MKNKLSFLSIPYVIWMALFTVAPIVMVVVYAFTGDAGGFTMENFSDMGSYAVVFGRSFKLAFIATHVADAKTCVLHPASTTHRQMSDAELLAAGVSPDLVRLSVGIEDVQDLLSDVENALNAL